MRKPLEMALLNNIFLFLRVDSSGFHAVLEKSFSKDFSKTLNNIGGT
jgi:hypothetical protein